MIALLEPSKAYRSPRLNPPNTPAAPFNWYIPEITGGVTPGGSIPVDGQPLTGTIGMWTGYGKLTFTYSWKRDGTIVGTNPTYTYQFPDDFADITFSVTATDSLGQSTTANSLVLQSITSLNFEDIQALHTFINVTYPTEFLATTDGSALTGLTNTLAAPGYWG